MDKERQSCDVCYPHALCRRYCPPLWACGNAFEGIRENDEMIKDIRISCSDVYLSTIWVCGSTFEGIWGNDENRRYTHSVFRHAFIHSKV